MAESIDINELADKISDRVFAKFDERFKAIEYHLKSIDSITTGTKDDLGNDRKDIGIMKTSSAGAEQGMKELLDVSSNQEKKIVEAVGKKIDEKLNEAPKVIADQVQPKIEKNFLNFLQFNRNTVIKKKKRFWFF